MATTSQGDSNASRKRLRCQVPGCDGFYLRVILFEPDGTGWFYIWRSKLGRYIKALVTHDNKGVPAYLVAICSKGNRCPLPMIVIHTPSQAMLDMMDSVDCSTEHLWRGGKREPVGHFGNAAEVYDTWSRYASEVKKALRRMGIWEGN